MKICKEYVYRHINVEHNNDKRYIICIRLYEILNALITEIISSNDFNNVIHW